MSGDDPLVQCSTCGVRGPRSEMFGIEPDLQCTNCAHGIRERMQVRVRTSIRDRKPIVTFTVILIAAVFFFIEEFLVGRNDAVTKWFLQLGFYLHEGPRIWDGEVWPLLASAFFHGGWMHIIFNCWWIWDLGRAIEWGFGPWQMVLLVVGSAMISGGAQWVAAGPGVGLSGVVYAVAGFLFVHRKTNPIAAVVLNERTAKFLAAWLVICVVLTELHVFNIGNWAHGAGAAWGLAAGWVTLHRRRKLFVPLFAALTIALVALTPLLSFGVQAEGHAQDRKLKEEGASDVTRWNRYYDYWISTRKKK